MRTRDRRSRTAAERGRMRKYITRGAAVALCIVCFLVVIFNALRQVKKEYDHESTSSVQEEDDMWIKEFQVDDGGKIVAALQHAMMGDSSTQKKLEVYTQEVTDVTKLTDEGNLLFRLGAKYQYVKYTGTAAYFVDLSKVGSDQITVNTTDKTVTITIPHTSQELDIDEEKTTTEETEKIGIFAVGDPKLSEEERKRVITEVREEMANTLSVNKASEKADEMALLIVRQIYEPVVSVVSKDYKVNIQFENAT